MTFTAIADDLLERLDDHRASGAVPPISGEPDGDAPALQFTQSTMFPLLIASTFTPQLPERKVDRVVKAMEKLGQCRLRVIEAETGLSYRDVNGHVASLMKQGRVLVDNPRKRLRDRLFTYVDIPNKGRKNPRARAHPLFVYPAWLLGPHAHAVIAGRVQR